MTHRRTRSVRRLEVEALGRRMLLAGDVIAMPVGETLLIQGDAEANAIRILPGLVITGMADSNGLPTTVNGAGSASFDLSGINQIDIRLSGGNDTAELSDLFISGDLIIDTGNGADSVSLANFFGFGGNQTII